MFLQSIGQVYYSLHHWEAIPAFLPMHHTTARKQNSPEQTHNSGENPQNMNIIHTLTQLEP